MKKAIEKLKKLETEIRELVDKTKNNWMRVITDPSQDSVDAATALDRELTKKLYEFNMTVEVLRTTTINSKQIIGGISTAN